jgi:hypothetical protein
MWALCKFLLRQDVAIRLAKSLKLIYKTTLFTHPPPGCARCSREWVEFWEAERQTILVDRVRIRHLTAQFKAVDPTLAGNYAQHFMAACTDPYRQGKAFYYPNGWRTRTPEMDVEDSNWEPPEVE